MSLPELPELPRVVVSVRGTEVDVWASDYDVAIPNVMPVAEEMTKDNCKTFVNTPGSGDLSKCVFHLRMFSEDYPCTRCGYKNNGDTETLFCDVCNLTYHTICAAELFREIGVKRSIATSGQFKCPACIAKSDKIKLM